MENFRPGCMHGTRSTRGRAIADYSRIIFIHFSLILSGRPMSSQRISADRTLTTGYFCCLSVSQYLYTHLTFFYLPNSGKRMQGWMELSIGSMAVGPHPQSVIIVGRYSVGLPVRLGVEHEKLSEHLSFYSRSQRRSADCIYLLLDISGHFLLCVAFVSRWVGTFIRF
jgi:hypothetical protein